MAAVRASDRADSSGSFADIHGWVPPPGWSAHTQQLAEISNCEGKGDCHAFYLALGKEKFLHFSVPWGNAVVLPSLQAGHCWNGKRCKVIPILKRFFFLSLDTWDHKLISEDLLNSCQLVTICGSWAHPDLVNLAGSCCSLLVTSWGTIQSAFYLNFLYCLLLTESSGAWTSEYNLTSWWHVPIYISEQSFLFLSNKNKKQVLWSWISLA